MMMQFTGPLIYGVHLEVWLMLLSGVFYLVCAGLLLKPVRQEKNELVNALFAFLAYQAVSMFFMGLEMWTHNMVYSNIAALAVFVGSVYMLKFPLSSLSEKTRKVIFYVCLVVVLALFVWFIQTEEREMMLMTFTLWYDLVVNGVIVGGFMILLAIKTAERWLKIKAVGGGSGVLACCVAANGFMLTGAMFASAVFQFLAPVVILASLFIARKKQNQSSNQVPNQVTI